MTIVEEAAKIFAKTGYSRLLVYENNMDEILGILYQKDFYNAVLHTEKTIREAVRPVLFVAKIDNLMKELHQKNEHDEVTSEIERAGEGAYVVSGKANVEKTLFLTKCVENRRIFRYNETNNRTEREGYEKYEGKKDWEEKDRGQGTGIWYTQ